MRLGLGIELLLPSLASRESLAAQMNAGTISLDEFVENLLDFLTGALVPSKVADPYFHLAQQHRSAWTHEIDLRAFSDRPWWNH
jgi:hypothetical protein